MKENKQASVLIVGAGLAGICLARRLHEKNILFTVIDSGINKSSVVAAGVINPLVFRRMNKSWRIDEQLPEARDFYTGLEAEWGGTYYNELPIRRAFAHQQEYDFWVQKQDLPEYSPYMKTLDEADHTYSYVKNTFGTGRVEQASYISTAAFLVDATNWLRSMDALLLEVFEYAELDPETATYRGVSYDQVVFCEGFQGLENPWFNYLPLQATKGEILHIHAAGLPEDELLNRKCFMLPLGEQKFKLGATYTWDTPDTIITEEARQMLVEQAESLINVPFEVERQEAGIRPTVEDRRPLIGQHPAFAKLHILNGLGSKGYLMAPLLSLEFVEFLLTGKAIDAEADIQRFRKKYVG
jgi:glycine oxidase